MQHRKYWKYKIKKLIGLKTEGENNLGTWKKQYRPFQTIYLIIHVCLVILSLIWKALFSSEGFRLELQSICQPYSVASKVRILART